MDDGHITRIPLVMDGRERESPIPEALSGLGVFSVEVKRLPVGDYLLDGALLIERKTLPDLAESIKDGRLFSQAVRLKESKVPAALLLEGTTRDLVGSGMRSEAIQGALISVALFIGLPILRSRDPQDTVRTFLYAVRQRRMLGDGALSRRGRRPKGKAALQRYILQGLPGVGPERAARLLQQFNDVSSVVTAEPEALAKVPGIGRRTAGKIRWAVEEPRGIYLHRMASIARDREPRCCGWRSPKPLEPLGLRRGTCYAS